MLLSAISYNNYKYTFMNEKEISQQRGSTSSGKHLNVILSSEPHRRILVVRGAEEHRFELVSNAFLLETNLELVRRYCNGVIYFIIFSILRSMHMCHLATTATFSLFAGRHCIV